MDRYIDELTSYLHNLSMDERQNAVDFTVNIYRMVALKIMMPRLVNLDYPNN
ncbi:hypothetical protein [Lentilactobacillus kosonis]|uniref:hypothetical protein n=1 Tax=Lentilactobacillus kosonis TaxID=2810561 RepID=UPI001CDC5A2E|nr:hypothetical protein [Lentilactobacillus kosonis]